LKANPETGKFRRDTTSDRQADLVPNVFPILMRRHFLKTGLLVLASSPVLGAISENEPTLQALWKEWQAKWQWIEDIWSMVFDHDLSTVGRVKD
jgi:hypothetical protein